LTALTAGGKLNRQEDKQMKLFAKIGAVSLVGGVVVALSATGFASKAQAEEDYTAMKHAQALARAENDVIKLNCVNDKLVQAKALLNIIDTGNDQASVLAQDTAQLHELRIAADGCNGRKQITEGSTNSFTGPEGASEPNPDWNGWGTTFEPGANASQSTPSSPRKLPRK
jgi:hypothetical protein